MHQLSANGHTRCHDGFHGQQHRRHSGFLLAGPFSENDLARQPIGCSVRDIPRVRVRHRCLRLIYRIGDEHQRAT